ncbi:MAG TPA: hypothetical protein VGF48_00600 [Thermoanaerobaculia bacterium]
MLGKRLAPHIGVATKKKNTNVKKSRELPYWLAGGENVCQECDGLVSHAVQAHCVDCDAAVCPFCAVHVKGEIFCATCTPQKRKIG